MSDFLEEIEEEIEEEVVEEIEDFSPPEEEEPIEEEPQPEGEPEEEEFDEIKFNHETIKVPASQRKELLQKGFNHDRLQEKLQEKEEELMMAKQQQEELARLYGKDYQSTIKELREQLLESRAIEEGTTPEILSKQLDLEYKVKNLEQVTRKAQITSDKMEFKSKRFFNDLESDIDRLLASDPAWSVSGAYKYLVGEKLDDLLAKETTQKKTYATADKADQVKRGIKSDGTRTARKEQVSEEMKQIAEILNIKL